MANAKKKNTARRGNNEGCIYYRENEKRWAASVTLGYDDDGKRIRKVIYGKTRSEVAVKMTTLLGTKLKGGHASVKNDTLQVLMHQWIITFKRAEVSPRTFERILSNAKNHIYPEIGNMKLDEITDTIIQSLLNRMLFAGYALATVRKVKFTLNQFFAYAKKSKFVDSNPVAECKVKSTKEHKEKKDDDYKAIPIDVRKQFFEVISNHPFFEPLCMVQLFGGMRIGEVLAIKWKDFDFVNDVIVIDNAITQIPEFDADFNVIGRKTVISDTKTCASVREVPMPAMLKKSLLRWKENREKRQALTGISFTAPDDLVFSNDDGELRTYYGTRSMFKRLMKKTGLDKYNIHFHSIRHTYSSMLFEAQKNPKVIQQLLGHKDVTTTIKTYNSVDRSYFKQATDKLEDKFKK